MKSSIARETIQHYINEVQELIDSEKMNLLDLNNTKIKNFENFKDDKFIQKKYNELKEVITLLQDNISYLSGKKDAYIECIKLYKI